MNILRIFRRYFLTIYDLKPRQIGWRIYKKLFPSKNYFLSIQSQNHNLKIKTFFLKKKVSLIDINKFRFLNITKTVKSETQLIDFKADLLWIYNLNYFDYLNSTNTKQRKYYIKLFIERWLREANSQQYVGWDPYPSSIRIVNFIKWLKSNKYENKFLIESLGNQTEKLSNNIEWHLYGNHLIANAKALIFAGIFFKSLKANKWKVKGVKLLKNQLDEQVLRDGGHFEKSPMYHSIVLEDILDIINIIENEKSKKMREFKAELINLAKKMINWLDLMSLPNGELSFFNDTTNGVAPRIIDLLKYSKRLGVNYHKSNSKSFKMNHLKESGFIVISNKNFKSILDVGSIGPKYIPGHAHADTLSFEMCFKNKKFIVNSGISTYQKSKQRLYERGTSAHSTVTINNENSSEIWSSFRVAHKANIVKLILKKSNQKCNILATHDGYSKVFMKNLHSRNWIINKNSLVVTDKMTKKNAYGIANFILHPDIKLNKVGKNLNLSYNNNTIQFSSYENNFKVIKKPYFPEFNKKIDTNCISVKLKHGFSKVQFNWN